MQQDSGNEIMGGWGRWRGGVVVVVVVVVVGGGWWWPSGSLSVGAGDRQAWGCLVISAFFLFSGLSLLF